MLGTGVIKKNGSQFTWEFSVVSKCEDTVNILCYHTSQAPDLGDGYSQKNRMRVCGPLPKTLTLFMTKIYDIPYPIYDHKFETLFMT